MGRQLAHCRLYLTIPSNRGPGMVRELTEALAGGDIACVLLKDSGTTQPGDGLDRRLVDTAQEKDAAVLIEEDLEKAAILGADGVHISGPGEQMHDRFKVARTALGKNAIIGSLCNGLNRHDAMMLAEAGADYVAFGAAASPGTPDTDSLEQMIAWWAELFEVPCVAWNVEGFDQAQCLAELGADFVALENAVWAYEHGPGAAVRRLTGMLSEITRAA